MNKLCFLTSSQLPYLNDDDRALYDEAQSQGYQTAIYVWDELKSAQPNELYLVRSIWDYHLKYPQFREWLKEFSTMNLLNSPEVIRWNSDKIYLKDLKSKIVPTVFFRQVSQIKIPEEWDEIVIKPSISASAKLTFVIHRQDLQKHQDKIEEILKTSHLMVQPLIQSVKTEGEVSLIFFNDSKRAHYSHAVLKKPLTGDFRVQAEFGGNVESHSASPKLIDYAQNVIQEIPDPWLYARVDIVDYSSNPLLGELELIEPQLFFPFSKDAVHLFLRCLAGWQSS